MQVCEQKKRSARDAEIDGTNIDKGGAHSQAEGSSFAPLPLLMDKPSMEAGGIEYGRYITASVILCCTERDEEAKQEQDTKENVQEFGGLHG
jgi:hypothetical protein